MGSIRDVLGTLPPLDELINLASYDYGPYGEQLDQGRRRRSGGGLGMGNGNGLGEGSLPEGQGMGSGAGLEPEGAVDGQGMESSGAGLGVSASPEAQDKRRGAIQTTLGYAGMFYHARSGLYLTHYRAYDPRLGRWLSRDPIWEAGGINLYGYASDNPIIYNDPTGEFAAAAPVVAGAAALVIGAACYASNCGQSIGNVVKSGIEDIKQLMTAPGRVADSQIVRDYEEAASDARRCGREPPDRCKWLDENKSRYRQDQVIPTQKAWGCRRKR